MNKPLSIKPNEKGQSLVELAVSVVVLLIIAAGIVDLARLALAFSVLRDAAQEAATYGSAYPTKDYCGSIADHAIQSATGNFAPGDVSVDSIKIYSGNTFVANCSDSTAAQACSDGDNRIEVTVSGSFSWTMPLIGAIVGQVNTIDYDVSNDILRPVCE